MREAPEIEAKKAAAWKLSDAFLDAVWAAKEFDGGVYDRGTAVAVATMRYIIRERVDPFAYLEFVRYFLDYCVVVVDVDEENPTWH